jgi:hypothetical protein
MIKKFFLTHSILTTGFVLLLLLLFNPCVSGWTSNSRQKQKSLKNIYQSGKIEFTPELKITIDSIPEHVDAKMLGMYCIKGKYVYVTDPFCCDIKIFTTSGQFVKHFGQKGKGPGDMFRPFSLVFSVNNLVVWENMNRRFSIYDSQGDFIMNANPKYRGRVIDIKSLDDGRIIVEREASGWIEGKFEQYFGLELFSKELVYIKDLYQKQILKNIFFRRSHRNQGNSIQPFAQDVSWDVLPGNKFVIGYSGNYQLEIHNTTTGKLHTFIHTYMPVKVNDADKIAFFESLGIMDSNGRLKKGADEFTRKNTIFPVYKPSFRKIVTDYEGNILVFVYKKEEEVKTQYKAKYFDAFDSKGNFINHVEIVSKGEINIYRLFSIKDKIFWSIDADALDPSYIKYRLR